MGHYSLFLISCLVFAFVPGPAMLYMISKTIVEGKVAGFRVVVGVFCGSQVHVLIAATGAASLLHASSELFIMLRFLGGGYFLYLGISKIYSLWKDESDIGRVTSARLSSFRESFLVEALNPKSSLFYFSFIPQFLPQETTQPVLVLFFVGTLANLIMSLGDMLIVLISATTKSYLLGARGYEKFGKLAIAIIFLTLGGLVITG